MTQQPFPHSSSNQSPGSSYSAPYGQQHQAFPSYDQAQPPKKETNVLGIVAFILSIVGFLLSCIPFIFVLGWVVLFVAFVLSIVALCLENKSKLWGVIALISTIVGGILSAIVMMALTFGIFATYEDPYATDDSSWYPGEATDTYPTEAFENT